MVPRGDVPGFGALTLWFRVLLFLEEYRGWRDNRGWRHTQSFEVLQRVRHTAWRPGGGLHHLPDHALTECEFRATLLVLRCRVGMLPPCGGGEQG